MASGERSKTLAAPFPYFGGKSRVAAEVWRRFGVLDRYVEPFAGSLAVLLAAPTPARSEIVNDAECLVTNFWRAVKVDPEGVARHCSDPINEADLHTRHTWLVRIKPQLRALMELDAESFDVRAAGWWVWGISQWIGGGFGDRTPRSKPNVSLMNGVFAGSRVDRLPELMISLSERLRRVRVICGDWSRCVTSSIVKLPNGKPVGVFLDPPYLYSAGRAKGLYASDDGDVAVAVRSWAIEHGDDTSLRIALCGYEGEHEMPPSWSVHEWKAQGGRSTKSTGQASANRHRERVWFSPHCLR